MNLIESRTTLIITHVVLALAAITALFPIALMVLNALKATVEIVDSPLSLPETIRWDNFQRAWRDANFTRTFFNSALLTAMTIILVCTTESLTAYVLARKKIRSWRLVTAYLLATTTAPIQLFLFPLYFGFAKLGLINNVFAVSVVYCAIYSPFSIMLLRTYFLAVPKELEESALVDGATHWQVFTRVYLPLVWPGILTVSLIVGLYTWNEFLIATTFLQAPESRTAVVSYFLLSGQYQRDWGELMATPLLYPGQRLTARVIADDANASGLSVCLRLRHYGENDKLVDVDSDAVMLEPGQSHEFDWTLPECGAQPVAEIGIIITA